MEDENSVSTQKKINNYVSINEVKNAIEPKSELDLFQIQKVVKDLEEKNEHSNDNKIIIDNKTLFKFCCKVCRTKDDKEKFNTYEIANTFLIGRLDLTYYLKMIDHINKLKTLILKPYQILMLDNQKKINLMSTHEKLNLDIADSDQFSSKNDLHMHLLQIVIEKIRDKSFEVIDHQLYELIDNNLKQLIDNLIKEKPPSNLIDKLKK